MTILTFAEYKVRISGMVMKCCYSEKARELPHTRPFIPSPRGSEIGIRIDRNCERLYHGGGLIKQVKRCGGVFGEYE